MDHLEPFVVATDYVLSFPFIRLFGGYLETRLRTGRWTLRSTVLETGLLDYI
jgi:hypothetical protein